MSWLASVRLRPGVLSGSCRARCTQQFPRSNGTGAAARAFSESSTLRLQRPRLAWLSRVPGLRFSKHALDKLSRKAFSSQLSVARQTGHPRSTEDTQRPAIGWPIAATLAVSGLAYYTAASRTNSTTRDAERLQAGPELAEWTSRPENREFQGVWSNVRMVEQMQLDLKLEKLTQPIRNALSSAPQSLQDAYASMVRVYREQRFGLDGLRAALLITGVNVTVWFAWKVPRLRPFMRAHFRHDPLNGKVYTMVTSVFSNETLLDLAGTTLVLTVGISRAVSLWMDQQQQQPGHLREGRSIYHFLAFFVSASMFSSLFFHIASARMLYPRLVKQLASKFSTSSPRIVGAGIPRVSVPYFSGSMGVVFASCTIMALECLLDTPISVELPFLPALNFIPAYGVGGVVLFDCIAALHGWRMFDHYTHLGGVLFGVVYWMAGARFWEWTRRHVWGEKPGENERDVSSVFRSFKSKDVS